MKQQSSDNISDIDEQIIKLNKKQFDMNYKLQLESIEYVEKLIETYKEFVDSVKEIFIDAEQN